MGISSSKKSKSDQTRQRGAEGSKPKAEEKAKITESDRVKLQLKMQRDSLSAAIRKYERVEKEEHEKAKEFMKAGNKRKALYCLKREKMQGDQIKSVTAMLDNIQQLIDTVEFVQIESEVVGALKDGKEELQKLNAMLNIDDIEKLMDETAESVEEAKQIDAVLNQPLEDFDNDDLLKELEELTGKTAEANALDPVKVPTHALPESNPEKTTQDDSETDKVPARVAA